MSVKSFWVGALSGLATGIGIVTAAYLILKKRSDIVAQAASKVLNKDISAKDIDEELSQVQAEAAVQIAQVTAEIQNATKAEVIAKWRAKFGIATEVKPDVSQ